MSNNEPELTDLRKEIQFLKDENHALRAELKALRKSKSHLDRIMQVSNDGVYDWNVPKNEIHFDPRYYTMAGYDPYEFPETFEQWAGRVHPDDFAALKPIIQDYLAGKTPTYEEEFRFKRKNGSWMWIRARVKIISRNKKREPLKIVGIHSDITQQKEFQKQFEKANQSLKGEIEKYTLLFNSSNDAIFFHPVNENGPGNFIEVNDMAVKLLGYSRKELLTMSPADIDLPEMNEAKNKAIANLQKTGDCVFHMRHLTKSGQKLDVEISSRLIEKDGRKYALSISRNITERKALEKRLGETQMHYTDFINASSDNVSYWKMPEGLYTHLPVDEQLEMFYHAVCVDANIAYCKTMGYQTKKELIGKKYTDLIKERTLNVVIKKLIENNYFLEDEQFIEKNKFGDIYYGITSWYGVVENGALVNLWSTTKNITELKKAEQNLRDALDESHRRQKEIASLLEASRSIPEMKSFNEAAGTIFNICKKLIGAQSGYVALLSKDGQKNEVLLLDPGGLPCTADPDLPMPIRGLREVAYRTNKAIYDNHFNNSDWIQFIPQGHVTLKNVLFAPIIMNKNTIGLIGLANKPSGFVKNDLTISRAFGELAAVALTYAKKQEELVKNEEKFRSFFKTTRDGAFIASPNGSFINCNQLMVDLFGYKSKQDLMNLSVEQLYANPEDRQVIVDLIIQKGSLSSIPIAIRKMDGTVKQLLMSASTITEKTGEVVAIHGNLTDVTEFRKMEGEKYELEKQLQQSQKMQAIGQLASGIAHDFNNTLGGVVGFADLALDEAHGNKQLSNYLNNILKAADRAKRLVMQILTFSREGPEEKRPLALQPVIEEVIEMLRVSLPSSVSLKTQVDKDTCPIIADATKVHEVLMNLATNAVHAMDEKGELTLYLHEERFSEPIKGITRTIAPGFYSIIEIQDTGIGMTDELITHIFEPFYTTKEKGKGTGLGLSVVFGVMESHNGYIDVKSHVGKGTTFRLFFPKTKQEVVDTNPIRMPLQRGNERILFVDDEEMLVEIGKEMLSSLGYQVTATINSSKALQLFNENPSGFDLLITDQTMPTLTGVELAEQILKVVPNFPTILCTGYSSKVDREKAKQMGITGFINKPITKQEMAKAIRSALDETPSQTPE